MSATPEACPGCGDALPTDGNCPACTETLADTIQDTRQRGSDLAGPSRIAGYAILRELGAGGMGAVYEAYEEAMNRKVALKVLSRHHAPSEKSARRFEQEAWIAGKLEHPNIVKVFERGEWEELSYYSMELIDGGSLHDVIRNMKQWARDERLGLEFGSREYVHWAINQVIQASRALHHAHQRGVIHRDIKPMNLLLSREQNAVKIADFGLAIDEDATRLTSAGKMLGTLPYMAPEQMLGKRDQMSPRTDVYALGATLFELLTLELPHRGDTQQMYMNSVLTSEARRPRKLNERISRDLEIVIGKALQRDPSDRYATAAELADDLDNVLRLRPIHARPTGALTRVGKWMRRKPIHAALLVTVIVASVLTGIFGQRELQRRSALRAARVESLLDEARWLEDRKRYDEMLDRAERVLSLDADNARALSHRALARMHVWRNESDPARAETLKTASLADISRVVDSHAEASWPRAIKAHILRGFKMEDEAAREQEIALSLRGSTVTADELELEARLAMGTDEYKRAAELLSQVVEQQPENAYARASLGVAYDFQEDLERAHRHFSIAVGLNPGFHLTFIDLGRISMLNGDLDEAQGHLDRALALDANSAIAHVAVADHHTKLATRLALGGETDRALDLLRKAESAARRSLELDPNVQTGQLNLGASLAEQYRLATSPDMELLAQAMEAYQAFLSRQGDAPDDPRALDIYVRTLSNACDGLIRLEQFEDALDSCRRAVEMQPKFADAHYNLAGLYAQLGRVDEALASLRRDVELGDYDWGYLMDDGWFTSLHENQEFQAIVEQMKMKQAKQ